jgi:hypothetical protein
MEPSRGRIVFVGLDSLSFYVKIILSLVGKTWAWVQIIRVKFVELMLILRGGGGEST